jgi:organic hydroperoxide reductase OsmC/OhrA
MKTYQTTAIWKGGHVGEIRGGNGAQFDFSAPAALYGQPNMLTPEDAFVGALNMCFQLMFIWIVEKMRIDLISYECEAEGFVEELLDQTSIFKKMILRPKIKVHGTQKNCVRRAIVCKKRSSALAQSIKAELVILNPEITTAVKLLSMSKSCAILVA